MTAKNKKSRGQGGAPSGGSLRDEVLHLIQKERFKDAVKQGKLCFRADSSPENHQLLEKAYFLRAQQLSQEGMPSSATEVSQHLLEFGVTDQSLFGVFAELLIRLGMTKESAAFVERLGDTEATGRLRRLSADQAVIHPERAASLSPEMAAEARMVRSALEALDRGDEAAMGEQLRDIARSSDFADWKLFARGLAAHYRGDVEASSANWGRLDSDRAASRIARTLGAGTEASAAGAIPENVEKVVFGEPVLAQIEELRQRALDGRWAQALRYVGPLRFSLARVDPALPARLTRILYSTLIDAVTEMSYRDMVTLAGTFVRVAQPLPIDPKWNRFWALIWQGPHGDFEQATGFWRKYIDDLRELAALAPSERPLAQALVLNYLARHEAEYADQLDDDFDDDDFDDDDFDDDEFDDDEDLAQVAADRAIASLEESLAVCPTHLPTYRQLIKTYIDWEKTDEVIKAGERLLQQFPDDLETLQLLGREYSVGGHAAKAVECITRARALKPLDQELVNEEWVGRTRLVLEHALAKRWEEGRAELARVEQLQSNTSPEYAFTALKAVFERKAGQAARSSAMIETASAELPDPAPFWLALQAEATRFKLPKAEISGFGTRLKTALRKKCNTTTASELASLLNSYFTHADDYPSLSVHAEQVAGYLSRGTKLAFAPGELKNVCLFLLQQGTDEKLLEKFAARGLKENPDTPLYLLVEGCRLSQSRNRGYKPAVAKQKLERALELARKSSDVQELKLVPFIKRAIESIVAFPGLRSRSKPRTGGNRSPFDFSDPAILPPELRRMLDEACAEQGLSPAEVLAEIFQRAAAMDGEEPPPSRTRGKRR